MPGPLSGIGRPGPVRRCGTRPAGVPQPPTVASPLGVPRRRAGPETAGRTATRVATRLPFGATIAAGGAVIPGRARRTLPQPPRRTAARRTATPPGMRQAAKARTPPLSPRRWTATTTTDTVRLPLKAKAAEPQVARTDTTDIGVGRTTTISPLSKAGTPKAGRHGPHTVHGPRHYEPQWQKRLPPSAPLGPQRPSPSQQYLSFPVLDARESKKHPFCCLLHRLMVRE